MLFRKEALRKLLLLVFAMTTSLVSFSQTTEKINYQAVARDADGIPFADTTMFVEISVLGVGSSGNADSLIYDEGHNVTTNRFGLFTLQIGDGAPNFGGTVGAFSNIDWTSGTKSLNVAIGSTDLGTTEFTSVPYALYAKEAGNVLRIDSTYLVDDSLYVIATNQGFDTTNFTPLLSLSGGGSSAIDSAFIANDTTLRIASNGDTFNISLGNFIQNINFDTTIQDLNVAIAANTANLAAFIGANLDSFADNELIDSITFDGTFLRVFEAGAIADSADLSSLAASSFNDTLVSATIIGSELALVDNTGDTVFADISSLASLSQLSDSISLVQSQLNDSINLVQNDLALTQADLAAFILANVDSFADNELIDSITFDGTFLRVFEAGAIADSADLSSLAASSFNDTLVSANIIGSELALVDNTGDTVFADISSLASLSQLSDSISLVQSQLNDSINLVQNDLALTQADLAAFILANVDSFADNELVDSLTLDGNFLKIYEAGVLVDSVDLAGFNSSANDSIQSFTLQGDTLLFITDGNGSIDSVNISSLATDAQLTTEVANLNIALDADSAYLNDSIDAVAINLTSQVNFLLNELDNDSTYLNDSIDVVAANLAAFISGSVDTVSAVTFVNSDTLRIFSGDGDSVEVSLASLATDAELALAVANLNVELDADSTFLNDSIDQVAANLTNQVNFLLNELDNDSTYLNDSIDVVAANLAAFISGSVDTVSAFTFVNSDTLRIFSGDGDSVEVSLASLATDAELALAVANLNVELDADSTFLNDSIDQVAANLTSQVNFLLAELDADSTYLNDSIDVVAANLAAFISGSVDTVSAVTFVNSDTLRIFSGDGDSVEVSLATLATDAELALAVANLNIELDADSTYLNDSIDQVAANLTSQVNFLLAELDADSTYLNDSIDVVAANLAAFISGSVDTVSAVTFVNSDTLRIFSGDGDSVEVSLAALATDAELALAVANLNIELDADSTYLNDSIDVVAANLDLHIAQDLDTDNTNEVQSLSFNGATNELTLTNPISTPFVADISSLANDDANELITGTSVSNDSLFITEGGITTGIDLGGLSSDTLALIRSLDSSTYVSTSIVGEVNIGLNDTTRYTFLENRIETKQASVYIGTGAGQNDPIPYADSVSNVAIGYHALQVNNGNYGTVAIGAEALASNGLNGPDNTAVGNQAMKNNFNGANNVAVGQGAMKSAVNPSGNVGVGKNSLLNFTTGNGNTAIGTGAGQDLTSGGANIFVGSFAGEVGAYSNRLYINNGSSPTPLIFGDFAADSVAINGKLNVNGNYTFPTSDGTTGQVMVTDGNGNLSFGINGASIDTINNFEMLVGNDSLRITTGDDVFDVDISSLATDAELATEVATINAQMDVDSTLFDFRIDSASLELANFIAANVDSSVSNELIDTIVVLGTNIVVVENGDSNFVNVASLLSVSSDTLPLIRSTDSSEYVSVSTNNEIQLAIDDTVRYRFLPDGRIQVTTPNIAIGGDILGNNTTGTDNVGLGHLVLENNTSGGLNIAIGSLALRMNEDGGGNTAVGHLALGQFVTGNQNTAIGRRAGSDVAGGGGNTYIGDGAGSITVGSPYTQSGVVKIGIGAGSNDSADNVLFIDNVFAGAGTLIWGDFANDILQVGGTFRTDNLSGDTLTYPTVDGSAGQVIVTDGNGNLSFSNTGVNDTVGIQIILEKGNDANNDTIINLGQLGIGTSTPTQALDVFGNTRITDSLSVGDSSFALSSIRGRASIFGDNEGFNIGLFVSANNAGVDTAISIYSRPADQGSTEFSFYSPHGLLYNQDAVSIGTDSASNLLSVAGNMDADTAYIDSLVINGAYGLPTSAPSAAGQVIKYDGTNLVWANDSIGNTTTPGLDLVLAQNNSSLSDTAYLGGLSVGSIPANSALINANDNTREISIEANNDTPVTSPSLSKGVFATATGNGTGSKYAIYGSADDNQGSKYGVFGSASGNGGNKYGIYGSASGTGISNYAGFFEQGDVAITNRLGVGNTIPSTYSQVLNVTGGILSDSVFTDSLFATRVKADSTQTEVLSVIGEAYFDNSLLIGTTSKIGDLTIESTDTVGQFVFMNGLNNQNVFSGAFENQDSGTGTKFGLFSRASGTNADNNTGVFGEAKGGGTSASNIGLSGHGEANGSQIGIGVFGTTSGTGINYAGYFQNGNVAIENRLSLGVTTPLSFPFNLNVAGDAFIDSIWTDSLVIGTGANQFAIAGSAGSNGDVLTFQNGEGLWQAPASGSSNDTVGIEFILAEGNDANGETIFNLGALEAGFISGDTVTFDYANTSALDVADSAIINVGRSNKFLVTDTLYNPSISILDTVIVSKIDVTDSLIATNVSSDTIETSYLHADNLVEFDSNVYITDTLVIGTGNNQYTLSGSQGSNGDVLTFQNDSAVWQASSGADNLGNHTATQALNLNGNYLSGDGDAEGVFVNADGDVGVGTNTPQSLFDVNGNASIQDSLGVGGVAEYGALDVYGEGTATYTYGSNEGNAYGLVAESENTGVDTSFAIYSNPINNGSDEYSFFGNHGTLFNRGKVGIGTSNPSRPLFVVGGAEADSIFAAQVHADELFIDGILFPDTVGASANDVLTFNGTGYVWQAPAPTLQNIEQVLQTGNDANQESVFNLNQLEVNEAFVDGIQADSVFTDSLVYRGFAFPRPDTAAANTVLTYDGTNMTWAPASISGDNLGNHTATQAINLNGNYLSGDTDNEGVFVDTAGKVGIGTNTPAAQLGIETTGEYGLDVTMTGASSGNNFGVSVLNSQSSTQTNIGVYSEMNGAAATNKGLEAVVSGGSSNFGLNTDVIDAGATENFGVRALADSSPANYAISGNAGSIIGGAGYAVFGNATGTGDNYAGYFENGAVYIQDSLILPNGAANGSVLTSDASGNASWQAPAAGGSSPWDTNSFGSIVNLNDTVFIGADSGFARFNVISEDTTTALFANFGNVGANNSTTIITTNANAGTGENTAIIASSSSSTASENYGLRSFAQNSLFNVGLVAVGTEGTASGSENYGVLASAFVNDGIAYGTFNEAAALSTGAAFGSYSTASTSSDSAIGVYGEATSVSGRAFAGYFADGTVFIKDSLIIDSNLRYNHSSVSAGYYLRTNADGTVYADTLAAAAANTCPVGFTQVNAQYCIETAPTAAADWYAASLACNALDAKLPTYSEWYNAVETQVLTNENTNWQWLDQLSQNNASIVGFGNNKARGADDPDAPTNTVVARCVYHLNN